MTCLSESSDSKINRFNHYHVAILSDGYVYLKKLCIVPVRKPTRPFAYTRLCGSKYAVVRSRGTRNRARAAVGGDGDSGKSRDSTFHASRPAFTQYCDPFYT